MDDPGQEFLASLLAYAVIAGASLLVAAAALWLAPYFWRRPLPVPRLRPGAWGGAEVLFVLLALPVAHSVVIGFLADARPALDPNARGTEAARLVLTGSPVWVTLTLAIICTLLFAISRTRPHQYGVTWVRWPANLIIGVLLYVVSTPPVLAVYLLLVLVFGGEVNVFEQMGKQGMLWWEWVLLTFMTVIGAPLTEELTYRGVLLGWLRRASLIGHGSLMIAILVLGTLPLATYIAAGMDDPQQEVLRQLAPRSVADAIAPLCFSALIVGGYGAWMFRLWSQFLRDRGNIWRWSTEDAPTAIEEPFEEEEDAEYDPPPLAPSLRHVDPDDEARQQQWAWANARLATYGSAALFGLVHGWPNSVPLMLLALGLGWLSYRTQSLVGCMVCHGLFNSVACLTLYWNL
jgi:membrane protease YdiL (CAAX protease family)